MEGPKLKTSVAARMFVVTKGLSCVDGWWKDMVLRRSRKRAGAEGAS